MSWVDSRDMRDDLRFSVGWFMDYFCEPLDAMHFAVMSLSVDALTIFDVWNGLKVRYSFWTMVEELKVWQQSRCVRIKDLLLEYWSTECSRLRKSWIPDTPGDIVCNT